MSGVQPEVTIWRRGTFYTEQVYMFSMTSGGDIKVNIQSNDQMEDMDRFGNSGEARSINVIQLASQVGHLGEWGGGRL